MTSQDTPRNATVFATLTGSSRAREAWLSAADAWPGVRVSPEIFCKRHDELSATSGGEPLALEAADLYLAVACLSGNSVAQARLQATVVSVMGRLGHFRLSPADRDDLVQSMMGRLLTSISGIPRLQNYSGRGSLEGWVHVLMTRAVLDRLRTSRQAMPNDSDVLLGLADQHDGELEVLKEQHRETFSKAFRGAIARLTVRQRNLLRQHYLDDLSLEDMGKLYRVHRATSARWLKEAREDVLVHVRDELVRLGALRENEIDSVMNLVRSRLDLSAGFFLSTAGPSSSERRVL